MSKKLLKNNNGLMEKIRTKEHIEHVVMETKKAHGQAVVKTYARTLLLVGFIAGFIAGIAFSFIF